jgi:predicted enzyme related to lactoylglutathione lyase
MRRLLPIILLVTLFANCNSTTKKTTNMEDPKNQTDNSSSPVDTTPKVTGIGGIFFFSDNPQKTKEWYGQNLGLEIDDYGSAFEFRNTNRPDEINYLRWSPFDKGSDYFNPSKKDFMINYRVQNIEGLVTKLKENGVTILDSIVTYDYGKFVHILDPEGNKIELWEPVDSVLTQMGGKTTK